MNQRVSYNIEHPIELYMDTDREVQRIKRENQSRMLIFCFQLPLNLRLGPGMRKQIYEINCKCSNGGR